MEEVRRLRSKEENKEESSQKTKRTRMRVRRFSRRVSKMAVCKQRKEVIQIKGRKKKEN